MKRTNWITTNDNYSIYYQQWENPSIEPKAIMQIAHGMAEHIDRYDEFANFLVERGILVYGNDHRGHGQTGKKYGTGYFDQANGFDKATNDLLTLTEMIKMRHPTLPIFLFGHSMGSFLVRNYLLKESNQLAGVILSGTGSEPKLITKIGKMIAKSQITSHGWNEPSNFLNKVVFGKYARYFKQRETAFDWLSRDQRNVKAYLDDPDTGFIPSASFFYDLFNGIEVIQDQKKIATIAKDLPFFFISGTNDPVGKFTKGVNKTIKQYQSKGINKIDFKFYQDARHELLHEINRQEVMEDIHKWLLENR
ncbi:MULTISPECIES: alpha/beta hydrolase [Paraliobacillus]|uniref:alpha/beta hydrolase n=1 Tax=Paraliobacillus TaxID=200903 RepID=UPI000DD498AD|nr:MULTISPECIES: alpha/beta hydrolase [Paraliobacillus]